MQDNTVRLLIRRKLSDKNCDFDIEVWKLQILTKHFPDEMRIQNQKSYYWITIQISLCSEIYGKGRQRVFRTVL